MPRRKRDKPYVFGKVLVKCRESRGMTRYALVSATGKKDAQIYSIERGENEPTVKTIIWLAEAMGMEPKDLFHELYLALKEEERQEGTRP